MIDDERVADELRGFYEKKPVARPDRIRMTHDVLDEIHGKPQGRRTRWWLPSFKRTPAPPPAMPGTEHQPSPIPATNGHTPTVLGRTQSMFSPAKAITAGALVFALGGVLLIAQPFDQQGSSVPGAATDAEPTSPMEVTGQVRFGGGVEKWTTDDPRLTGDATWDPAEGHPTDRAPSYFLNGFFLETDGGTWRALPIPTVFLPDQERPEGCTVPVHCLGGLTDFDEVLVGEEGYEGLTFVARGTWTANGYDVHGFIIEGEVPSAPEPWSAE